jgi:hypothetical protein
MAKSYHHIIVLMLAVVFVAACAFAPVPTSPPTAMPPTPTVTVAVPTSPPPTVVPPTAPASTATPAPPTTAPPTETSPERGDTMRIRITLEDTVLTATLVDSQTTQDFISLLPLTLTLEDYAGTEKISDLPRRLSTEGAPPGSDPSVGDIAYYAPWGNLALYYNDFGYSSGLIILGTMDSGIEALSGPGSVNVTIELIE